ncbi:MAG TPA: extracellular solute-binding protein [Acidimicrobiales bacterium]|nr:extracellular solute-binding protein [Acidimicrobiales bacterium]
MRRTAEARAGARLPRRGPRAGALVALVVTALILAGCGSTGAGTGKSGSVTLTLYSGQHQQTTDALAQAFQQESGITVKVRSNDEDTFADELVTEGRRTPADVFFTENTPPLEYLQQKGLLSAVDPSTLAKVASRFDSPQGDWVGVSARVSVLIYNPAMISAAQLPKRAIDLADPRYQGKLAIAPGETDFQPIVTSMLHAYGRARTLSWLEGVKRNGASHDYPDNETLANQVNRGQAAFALINQYYWWRLGAEIGDARLHSKIVYLANDDPGYVLDVSGAAVLKASKHQAAAEKFLAFLVSAKGQGIIAHSISYEYPIGSGVKIAWPETPFEALHPNPINLAELGTGATAIALLKQVQLL